MSLCLCLFLCLPPGRKSKSLIPPFQIRVLRGSNAGQSKNKRDHGGNIANSSKNVSSVPKCRLRSQTWLRCEFHLWVVPTQLVLLLFQFGAIDTRRVADAYRVALKNFMEKRWASRCGPMITTTTKLRIGMIRKISRNRPGWWPIRQMLQGASVCKWVFTIVCGGTVAVRENAGPAMWALILEPNWTSPGLIAIFFIPMSELLNEMNLIENKPGMSFQL